ncbi:MAG: polyprenol phosphomannose-dependent alpha 1,6 mannosyltransferase MptB [Bacteroidota bacterium]
MNHLFIALLMLTSLLFAGFGLDRTVWWHLVMAFGGSFLGYALILRGLETPFKKISPFSFYLSLGLVIRLALVFAFPTLSDDIYRFIWDGQLIRAGINPFAELPAYYLDSANQVAGLSPELYQLLNSPEYYTIYPPIAQGTFTLAVLISPESWYGASVVMKFILLLGEIGSAWLILQILAHYGLPRERLLLYWLNPLIIIEIVGNIHFEGPMIFFLLLALWAMLKGKWWLAGAGMALSVASKLLPLLLLPFLVKRLWPLKTSESSFQGLLIFLVCFLMTLLISFLPLFFAGFIDNFSRSFDLYFRRFEFNAGIYYLARSYGYWWYGSNQVQFFGPLLGKIAAFSILLFALLERGFRLARWQTADAWKSLPTTWMFAFVIYLLCTTTLHPWYLAVPIVLCIFGRWRFPLVWSALICLTYATYLYEPYQENLWLVAVEYGVVLAFFLYECKRGRRESSQASQR